MQCSTRAAHTSVLCWLNAAAQTTATVNCVWAVVMSLSAVISRGAVYLERVKEFISHALVLCSIIESTIISEVSALRVGISVRRNDARSPQVLMAGLHQQPRQFLCMTRCIVAFTVAHYYCQRQYSQTAAEAVCKPMAVLTSYPNCIGKCTARVGWPCLPGQSALSLQL